MKHLYNIYFLKYEHVILTLYTTKVHIESGSVCHHSKKKRNNSCVNTHSLNKPTHLTMKNKPSTILAK